MVEDVPRFIELRGCINCETYNEIREKGFHHEKIIPCVLHCGALFGDYSAMNPFIDPEEIISIARESGRKDYIENAREYLLRIKEKFGSLYEKIDVNINTLLQN